MPGEFNDETITYLSRDAIVKLVGLDAGAHLVAAFGGRRFSVPAPTSAGFEMLVCTLKDRAAATRLCTEFGGMRVMLPARLVQMRARIREMSRSGAKPPAIARDLQTSERYVYQVLAEKLIL